MSFSDAPLRKLLRNVAEVPSIAFEALERRQLLTAGPLGDLDRDGSVTAADVPAMLAALTDLTAYQSANRFSNEDLLGVVDVNGNGVANNADLQALISAIVSAQEKPPPPADHYRID